MLARAILDGADLAGAALDGADLSRASLRGVRFDGASMLDTTLSAADLSGADLAGCRRALIHVRRATFDEDTCWPAGFDAAAAGAVLVRRRDG